AFLAYGHGPSQGAWVSTEGRRLSASGWPARTLATRVSWSKVGPRMSRPLPMSRQVARPWAIARAWNRHPSGSLAIVRLSDSTTVVASLTGAATRLLPALLRLDSLERLDRGKADPGVGMVAELLQSRHRQPGATTQAPEGLEPVFKVFDRI